jgi:uncharacterized protein (DUF1778 family)
MTNPPTINTSIRITDRLREDIRKAAARKAMTRTDFVRIALEEAVKKQKRSHHDETRSQI